MRERTQPLLRLSGLHCGHGPVRVVDGADLTVRRGEICTLVGANGAGKSTLLGTVSGLLRPMGGTVEFAGTDITGRPPEAVAAEGLVHVAEGRRVFRGMTVRENLDLGLWRAGLNRARERERLEWILTLFPILRERLDGGAEVLSGGEQQMLVIGQALMRGPRLLLLDEPSLGLAPVVIERVFQTVRELVDEGLTVLLVEQVVERALELADWGYVMRSGRLVADGPAADLLAGPQVREAYLGAFAAQDGPAES